MNLKTALADATNQLANEPVGPPRMAAETLMMFALGCDRAYLHAHPEHELTAEEEKKFKSAVAERASGKPLQYITGHQEFWGLDFVVTPSVLIPRPETEHLVEAALDLAHKIQNPRIVDVGTGSGCIILSLAHELTKSTTHLLGKLHAVDLSDDALKIARQNAERLGLLQQVQFLQSDLLSVFTDQAGTFDLVISNPPYVGLCEQDKVQREVREHEPHVAVFGGEQGLDIYRRLIPQAHNLLKPGGWLLMEIGYSIEDAVRDLLQPNHKEDAWHGIRAIPDLQGIPRVVLAQKG